MSQLNRSKCTDVTGQGKSQRSAHRCTFAREGHPQFALTLDLVGYLQADGTGRRFTAKGNKFSHASDPGHGRNELNL